MNATEHLDECRWVHPDSYMGYSPVGDFCIYTRSRDGSILENTNYAGILAHLLEVASKHPAAPEEDGEEYRAWVHDFRAGHWGTGWVEYIIVRSDAPEEILQAAGEIYCAISEYPVFDDSAYSDACYREITGAWEGADTQDRISFCKDAGISIFAARREEIPDPVFDYLNYTEGYC